MTINRKDLEFLLSHFDTPTFPRRISTFMSNDSQKYTVNNIDEILERFKESEDLDCKINAYNYVGDEKAIVTKPPSLLDIDLDRKHFASDEEHRKARIKTMVKIRKVFCLDRGTKPYTILWSGGGWHILLLLDTATLPQKFFEYTSPFCGGRLPANAFLEFLENYLTDNLADTGHNQSVRSTMVRAIGSYNSKYDNDDVAAECKLVDVWDGHTRADIAYVLSIFYKYLIEKRRKSKQIYAITCRAKELDRINKRAATIKNIKNDWQQQHQHACKLQHIAVGDFRKRGASLLLAPYYLNIQHLSVEAAGNKILKWLDECNKVKPLDFRAYDLMRKALYYASDNNYLPLGLEKIREQDEELYNKLTSSTEVKEGTN